MLITDHLRYEDIRPGPDTPSGGDPPRAFPVELRPGERIVSVETIKNTFGYATARVWITRPAPPD